MIARYLFWGYWACGLLTYAYYTILWVNGGKAEGHRLAGYHLRIWLLKGTFIVFAWPLFALGIPFLRLHQRREAREESKTREPDTDAHPL